MNSLDLAVLSVASWRLAYMLAREDGPWGVFARLRAATTFGGLLDCVYCASVWTAAGMLLLWTIGGLAQTFVYVLALSALGLMAASWTGAGFEVQR